MKYTRKELIDIYRLANKLHFDDFQQIMKLPPSEEKKEEAKELDLSCDVCGKHPACIVQTQFGRYCMEHARYV